mmetsp:Transcript_51670/g.118715  ORF Transcript_51670/g.118715 Transcript_51670/m.118715 type:complete len:231 (+) Transcript_51670:504-1196(+)
MGARVAWRRSGGGGEERRSRAAADGEQAGGHQEGRAVRPGAPGRAAPRRQVGGLLLADGRRRRARRDGLGRWPCDGLCGGAQRGVRRGQGRGRAGHAQGGPPPLLWWDGHCGGRPAQGRPLRRDILRQGGRAAAPRDDGLWRAGVHAAASRQRPTQPLAWHAALRIECRRRRRRNVWACVLLWHTVCSPSLWCVPYCFTNRTERDATRHKAETGHYTPVGVKCEADCTVD